MYQRELKAAQRRHSAFHREASSLEEAIRSAIRDVRSAGFDVELVEMQPDLLPA